jgi:hypothetical protein
MRKLTCLLVLLLPVGAALAQQPAPTRYLTLIREVLPPTNLGVIYSSLTVVGPDGTIKTEEFMVNRDMYSKKLVRSSIVRPLADSSAWLTRRTRYMDGAFYQAETRKLNELGAQGWELVNTLQEGSYVRYLFRQDAPPRQ